MALHSSPKNTYEEEPDLAKNFANETPDEKGQRPKSKVSRDTLVRTHQRHLKLLSEGSVPIRNLILPNPYPPSHRSICATYKNNVHLGDLCIDSRDQDDVLLLRTIASPYVWSSTVTVAEDETGDVARLTVCNLEDNVVDPIVTEGSILAIKQPCWTRLVDGGYHVRVDHPSDFVLLKSDDELVPEVWRSEADSVLGKDTNQCKKDGDVMFLKKRFRQALELYTQGLQYLSSNPDPASEVDLYRKRCGVNIVLLRLDDAAKDLSLAISTHARSAAELSSSELVNASTVESWLHSRSTEDPLLISSKIPRALKELAARIKFDIGINQPNPDYKLDVISSYVGPLTLHVDAANYMCDTEIRQSGSHGRGLFAKKDFKEGDLICAEKALVLPGYFMQDRNSDCLLYNLGDGTAVPRPGAWLFKELVQKLRWNPSLRKEFFDLEDGGYWKEHGWELAEDEEIPVDVFRIEYIRRLNCFSAPTRSTDVLSQPLNSNPELRNGFWTHASYINHSCLPNTIRTFIGDILLLRAARDIASGEELTNQYVAPDIDIGARQEKYRTTWGFECDCELCAVDGSLSEDIRTHRVKQFDELKSMVMKLSEKSAPTITSLKKIARGLRELEALYFSTASDTEDPYAALPRLALVHPTLFLTEAWRSVKNVDRTIEYAVKLLRNFGILVTTEGSHKVLNVEHRSGLVNVETVRAMMYLAEGYSSQGKEELAGQCVERAKKWYVVITGAEVGMGQFFKTE
ncbi:SET domain-containing protein [Bimuria novae-zelandiae CBS 107.79]|uniref:SET domain-containing protein n=1 Tax=Bimuria novae-zelandiae CBS 107.79 TaxID=1447943 RepID=A0A6A5V9X4_9PLEO|nr:SET domain-containing protein [Bimuria novae-zelandiae CBS 107.79]